MMGQMLGQRLGQRWRWLLVGVPLVLGAGSILLIGIVGRDAVPIVYLRADLGTAIGLSSIGCALLIGGWLVGQRHIDHLRQHSAAEVQQQASEDRRRFLQRLDHELKNPLMAMRAGLANMAEVAGGEAGKAALQSVENQALRLSRLASDLRKLADLETRPLEYTAIDPAMLIQDIFGLAEEHPAAPERRLFFTLPQVSWSLNRLQGDYDLLSLALYNLADNALKFTRPGDTIEIRAFEDGINLVMEVADTGPGIPPDVQADVWEELYRAPAARGIAGSGLGLSLVRAIVLRHGGAVALRSRLDQGTVVTLRLPVKE